MKTLVPVLVAAARKRVLDARRRAWIVERAEELPLYLGKCQEQPSVYGMTMTR